jgi:hypothetical protein
MMEKKKKKKKKEKRKRKKKKKKETTSCAHSLFFHFRVRDGLPHRRSNELPKRLRPGGTKVNTKATATNKM